MCIVMNGSSSIVVLIFVLVSCCNVSIGLLLSMCPCVFPTMNIEIVQKEKPRLVEIIEMD